MKARCVAAGAVVSGLVAALAHAQAPPPPQQQLDATELAKKTQNPVGDMTSVPLQFNFNQGGDYGARAGLNLNLQPVIPFRLTSKWNAILRTIVPLNTLPAADGARESGVGDIQAQFYVTPAQPGRLIWGAGPMFSLPTATMGLAEPGSWGLGPGAVVLTMHGPWVAGGLVQQFWTIADSGGDPELNLFVLQPFVNYNLGDGWALSLSPIITAHWNAASGQKWTVPLGLGLTRTTVFNRRPMNIGVQYYSSVERPDGAPAQQLRFTIAWLFPR